MTASAPSPRLYPKLLGAAWASLDPVVQRVHAAPAETYAEGTAQVSRAPGRLLGYVLDAARVPRSSCASAVHLAVRHRGTAEWWHRAFGGRPLVTQQSEASGGLLAERLGMLEFRFRLAAQNGALLFRQETLALRLGALRIPLPGCISLFVAAREGPAATPDGDDDRTSVDVRVTLPTGTLLFAYRGTVRWRLREGDGPAGSRPAGRAAP
jgi:uncharacterized protein DUF4166